MKKLIISLVTLILALTCACAFVACNQEDDDSKNAAKWSGSVGTLPTAVENVIEIENGEQLAALAVAVNGGNTFAGYTVKLTADLNLDNQDWTPIGRVIGYPAVAFAGTFDGNSHVIYNMKTSANDAEQASAGLFGSITGTVKNLTLKNVTVSSTHYAGAITGYTGSADAQIINCMVDGGKITSTPEQVNDSYDNGDKVGGIIGYCANATVKNCTVKNVTITAYRDLGGIAGCADGANTTIENNTVGKNVKVVVDNTQNYKNYTTNEEYNAGSIVGRLANGSEIKNCTGTATITLPN